MADKQNFFKSNYFKSALVLVLLLVFCCALLAILSDALKVTEQERTMRVIKKIYGKELDYEDVSNKDGLFILDTAECNQIFLLEDGNKLYNVTGKGGYSNGSITLWIVVNFENDTPISIGKVVVSSNVGQTLMANFGDNFFEKYTVVSLEDIQNGKVFVTQDDGQNIKNVVNGASRSSNAMNNAVNAVLTEVFGEGV